MNYLLAPLWIYAWIMFLNPNNPKKLECMAIAEPINIDGHLNEWDYARSVSIRDKSQKSDASTEIKMLWDDQNLFLAFQVRDQNLSAIQTDLDHPQLFMDDMVEFLIDTENDKGTCWNEDDIIYHINLHGQKKDDRGTIDCITNPTWNGDAEYAIQLNGTLNDSTDIDTGYTVEISISWKELDLTPVPGLTMGLNLAIGDNGQLFDWVNAAPFRSPDAFGNLVLLEKPR